MDFVVHKFRDGDNNLVGMSVASSFIVGRIPVDGVTTDHIISADSPEHLILILQEMLRTQLRQINNILSDLYYFLPPS